MCPKLGHQCLSYSSGQEVLEELSWRMWPRGWRCCASLYCSTSLKPEFYTYFPDERLDVRKDPDPWCCSHLNHHLQVGPDCLQNDLMCLMGCHGGEDVVKPLKVFILSPWVSFVILSSRFRDTFFSSRTLICGMWYSFIFWARFPLSSAYSPIHRFAQSNKICVLPSVQKITWWLAVTLDCLSCLSQLTVFFFSFKNGVGCSCWWIPGRTTIFPK